MHSLSRKFYWNNKDLSIENRLILFLIKQFTIPKLWSSAASCFRNRPPWSPPWFQEARLSIKSKNTSAGPSECSCYDEISFSKIQEFKKRAVSQERHIWRTKWLSFVETTGLAVWWNFNFSDRLVTWQSRMLDQLRTFQFFAL